MYYIAGKVNYSWQNLANMYTLFSKNFSHCSVTVAAISKVSTTLAITKVASTAAVEMATIIILAAIMAIIAIMTQKKKWKNSKRITRGWWTKASVILENNWPRCFGDNCLEGKVLTSLNPRFFITLLRTLELLFQKKMSLNFCMSFPSLPSLIGHVLVDKTKSEWTFVFCKASCPIIVFVKFRNLWKLMTWQLDK